MKFRLRLSFLTLLTVLLFGLAVRAQTRPLTATLTPAHNVALTWVASTDAATNPTLGYQIYRIAGLATVCPSTLPTTVAAALATGFQLISGATALTATTYTDFGFPNAPLPPGNYCYFAVSLLNGAQSVIDPTGIAPAVVPPAPPTGMGKIIT